MPISAVSLAPSQTPKVQKFNFCGGGWPQTNPQKFKSSILELLAMYCFKLKTRKVQIQKFQFELLRVAWWHDFSFFDAAAKAQV